MGALLFLFLTAFGTSKAQDIPDPESHFGFRIGSDRHLVGWDDAVEYFSLIGDGCESGSFQEPPAAALLPGSSSG
jgi:hypothetical protein